MPRKKPSERGPIGPPASSPESRESQLIALAYDATEQRIRNGTASAQELVHFLRMGSTKERQEREMMAEQKKLLTAKTESLESSKRMEEVYNEALKAMRRYSGNGDEDDEE